jgi:autotransporter strand-loop-strand O-heptosyltransferase
MRIAQITPGVIPIPPNGWGAVEKIIWEYTKVLRNLGHHVEILYTDDVKQGEWDVVHVHMANLALLLKDKGIPYVFSHHDHHAYHFGKDSDVYKKNLEAIKGSVLSFVHAKYLVDYFESLPQLRYLGHGANIEDYEFIDRSNEVMSGQTKLLMMANNGLGGNVMYDRKGFIPGIEAARKLNLPITIVCPGKGNKELLSQVNPYDKLKVLYDLNYEDTLSEMSKYHIFLNPSMLEAGHPNLTVTESICRGIPVVGTAESQIPGQKVVDLKSDLTVDPDEIADSISEVISNYSHYVLDCKENRSLLSWEVVVSRMLMDYVKFSKISQKKLILDDYSRKIQRNHRRNEHGYYHWFNDSPYFYKSSKPNNLWDCVVFRDSKTGSVHGYYDNTSDRRGWYRQNDVHWKFIDWEIVIKDNSKDGEVIKMDLRGQHVLIKNGMTQSLNKRDLIQRFVESTGCIPTLSKALDIEYEYPHFKHVPGDDRRFYRILNTDQVADYFSPKDRIEERVLIVLKSKALGDTIAFLPYVNEYAKRKGVKCDVICNFKHLFSGLYPYIEIIEETKNLSVYSDVIVCNYDFEMPLQEGFASQLGISDSGRIRPQINGSDRAIPLAKRYVCFSMHSTAQAKHWNNNDSWEKLCRELKSVGLVPVCIDRYPSFGSEGNWNPIPNNCVNKTGMELPDMINWIEHCEFFVGLSSGLTWVAHALGKKCVMISGVTPKENEFTEDCIRIHRDDVCNSCFTKPSEYKFNPGDWFWCPEHKGTSRQFECTKRISAKQVMDAIEVRGWLK